MLTRVENAGYFIPVMILFYVGSNVELRFDFYRYSSVFVFLESGNYVCCSRFRFNVKCWVFGICTYLMYVMVQEVWLDKVTGRVCLSISAKSMSITGIEDRRYWNWVHTEESRLDFHHPMLL